MHHVADTNALHESYMRRCLELAALAGYRTAPNPMVGCVVVRQGRIIGEGYHRGAGQAHAEMMALRQIAEANPLPMPPCMLI